MSGTQRAKAPKSTGESVVFLDDLALARAALAGNPQAIAQLWARESLVVRRILRRTFGGSVDLDDLVQSVFVSFLERLDRIREPARVRSYLVSIALNAARSELRRRTVRRWVGLSPTGELPQPPVEPADHRSRRALQALYAVLDELSANARLAFVLRYIERMELTEVGEAMGWSLATTKRRVRRAHELVIAKAAARPELQAFIDEGGR